MRGSAAHELSPGGARRSCAIGSAARSVRHRPRSPTRSTLLDQRAGAAAWRPLYPDPPVDRTERHRLRSDLRRYLELLAAATPGAFEPREFELAFGLRGRRRSAPVDAAAASSCAGAIDRVDVDAASRRRRSSSTTRAERAADPVARWAAERRLQPALYMRAVEQLLGRRGGRRPLPAAARAPTCARAARCARTSTPGVAARSRTTAASGASCARCSTRRLAVALAAARRARRRRAASRARRAARPQGRCRYPAICRCEAPMSRAPFTAEQRAARSSAARGPFALAAARRQRQDQRARRALRARGRRGRRSPPARILAITFTDRAAGELRERVRARLVAAGRPRRGARERRGAFVSTFHGFCARLLRGARGARGPRRGLRACSATPRRRRCATRAFDAALGGWLERRRARSSSPPRSASTSCGRRSCAVYDELRSRGERAPRLPPPRPRHDVGRRRARLAAAAAARRAATAPTTPRCAALERAAAAVDRRLAAARRRSCASCGHSCCREMSGRGSRWEYERARDVFEEACGDAQGAAAVESLDLLLRGVRRGVPGAQAGRRNARLR